MHYLDVVIVDFNAVEAAVLDILRSGGWQPAPTSRSPKR